MTYDKSKFITAPWKGWDESLPSMLLPPSSFKQITGWLINKGRIQPFPNLNAFTGPTDGNPIQGAKTFADVVGDLHTVVLTRANVYYLNNTNTYSLQGATTATSFQTFAMETLLNKVFYANGVGSLSYVDGGAGVNPAGDVQGTCFVLGKLSGSLLELNLVESSQFFPLSVRWCAVNNPSEWDATIDPTAGSLLIPEVEDQINGFSNQKGQGVIYRSKGISILSATGSIPRFRVDSFENGDSGIGMNFSGTLGNYGDVSIFAAENDMYLFSLSQPQSIGGPSKKAIFQDLRNASSTPFACIMGSLGLGVDYLAYWLFIPLSNNTLTSVWIFHFDDGTWVNEQLPYGKIYWVGNVAVA